MADEKFANEIMSDGELNNVAGGGTMQTIGDQSFLVSQYLIKSTNLNDFFSATLGWHKISSAVDDG